MCEFARSPAGLALASAIKNARAEPNPKALRLVGAQCSASISDRLAVADYFELVSLMVVALLTCLLALYETLFYLEHTLGMCHERTLNTGYLQPTGPTVGREPADLTQGTASRH